MQLILQGGIYLRTRVALIRFRPAVDDPLFAIAVVADLDRKVRVGMPIIPVASLMFLEEFDENLLIHPGLNNEIRRLKPFKLTALLLIFVGARLLEILHDQAGDLLRPFLHPLHVEIDLRPNLVF